MLAPPGAPKAHGSRGPSEVGWAVARAPAAPIGAHRLQEICQFLPPVPALGCGQLVPLAPHSTALLLLRADLGVEGAMRWILDRWLSGTRLVGPQW